VTVVAGSRVEQARPLPHMCDRLDAIAGKLTWIKCRDAGN
jgi:hypothetical protein